MAIARDSSSPAGVQIVGDGAGGGTGTSAAFTPPAAAIITVCATINSNVGATPTPTISNTGGGLSSWTVVVSRINASGGAVWIWRATVLTSVSTTITVNEAALGSTQNFWHSEFYVDVWTGADPSQTGAQTTSGTSSTQSNAIKFATYRNGSQIIGIAMEWNAVGTASSSDCSYDAYLATGGSDGLRMYKSAPTSPPIMETCSFTVSATGALWTYAFYELLAPLTYDPPSPASVKSLRRGIGAANSGR